MEKYIPLEDGYGHFGDPSRGCYGIPPEVNEQREKEWGEKLLLERAESQREGLEKSFSAKKRKRNVLDSTYQKFYQVAKDFSFDMGSGTEEKTRLLIKYFPGRFGDKGRTSVCNLDYLQIGNLFNKMVNYSLKRINQ